MTTLLESYYLNKPEPYRSCLLALKDIILLSNPGIVHERKFQIPFFTYKDKKVAYLWLDRKKVKLGFCLDKSLRETVGGIKPKDVYESMQIDPNADIEIDIILQKLRYYTNRIDNM